jgi:DNA modification methylase
VWELGVHRVLCGDATSGEDFERVLAGDSIHLAFTSPPYAQQRDYGEQADYVSPDQYVEWFMPIARNIKQNLAADGSYFLNIKPSCEGLDTELYVFDLVLAHVRELGFHFATEFCWERSGVPKSVTQRFKNQFEPVYQFALNRWKMRPGAVQFKSDLVPCAGGAGSGDISWAKQQGGKGAKSVSGSFGAAKKHSPRMGDTQGQDNYYLAEYIGPGWAYPGNRLPTFSGTHEALGHSAAFPVGLPRFFILAFTDMHDVITDPFLGSGSTLIAAETESRRCYGLEIEPRYCDVIRARWEKFTGRTAALHRT